MTATVDLPDNLTINGEDLKSKILGGQIYVYYRETPDGPEYGIFIPHPVRLRYGEVIHCVRLPQGVWEVEYSSEKLFIGDGGLGADGLLKQKTRIVLSRLGNNNGNLILGDLLLKRIQAAFVPVMRAGRYNARLWFADVLKSLSKEGGLLVPSGSQGADQSIEALLTLLEKTLSDPKKRAISNIVVVENSSLGLRSAGTTAA